MPNSHNTSKHSKLILNPKLIDLLGNQSINQSTNQSINQSINHQLIKCTAIKWHNKRS